MIQKVYGYPLFNELHFNKFDAELRQLLAANPLHSLKLITYNMLSLFRSISKGSTYKINLPFTLTNIVLNYETMQVYVAPIFFLQKSLVQSVDD